MSATKTTRCVICRTEFTDEEIANASSCPFCKSEGIPMLISEDTQIRINWHELRILTIWASNYASNCNKPNMNSALASILKHLELQRPDGTFAPLTLLGELKELVNDPRIKGDIEMVDPRGQKTIIQKKKVN